MSVQGVVCIDTALHRTASCCLDRCTRVLLEPRCDLHGLLRPEFMNRFEQYVLTGTWCAGREQRDEPTAVSSALCRLHLSIFGGLHVSPSHPSPGYTSPRHSSLVTHHWKSSKPMTGYDWMRIAIALAANENRSLRCTLPQHHPHLPFLLHRAEQLPRPEKA